MTTIVYALASVIAVSLVSLIGVLTMSMDEARLRSLAAMFVSFAVGALLGDAFIHLIPRTFSIAGQRGAPLESSLLILVGMMVFFIVRSSAASARRAAPTISWAREYRPPRAGRDKPRRDSQLHRRNYIGASYLVSPTLGLSTTMAVLLHEIPQKFGDFGILIHSGLRVRTAVLLNLASASLAILGTVIALLAGAVAQEAVTALLLPITAGGFVYLAAADLIPELQHDRSARALFAQTGLISLGMAIMGLLTFVG